MLVQRDFYKFLNESANITQSINASPIRLIEDIAPVHVTKDTEGETRFNAF